MNRSTLSLLVHMGLAFSLLTAGHSVKAQGFSFPAQMNKSFTPLSIAPGGTAQLQVSIFNPNSFALTDATWTDNLVGVQPGIIIANPPSITTTCGGTVTASPGGTTLSLSGGMVPAQSGSNPGSCTVSVNVTSYTPGNLINTIPAGTLTSSGGDGTVTNTSPASATLHVDIVRPPTLSKGFSPNTILVGQTSQLTIRIRNNDLNLALTQASLTDQLPADVVLASPVSPSLSGCGGSASLSATSGGSSVTLTNSTIAADSTCTIRVNVTSTVSGVYANTIPADALDTEQGLTNASPATANLNVQDIGVSKSFAPPGFQAGGVTTLTITLRNPTSSAYTGVQISDTLPGNVLTIVPNSASTTCGGTVSITQPRTVTLSAGIVPAGTPLSPGTCTITVQVTAPEDAGEASYTNTIPAGTLTADQDITNSQDATARVRVYAAGGGVTSNKSFSPSLILAGENSRLRINITAPLDTGLTNFSITDNLPADVTISNSSPATTSNCGSGSVLTATLGATSVTLSNGTIPAGTTCQINVYVTSSVSGAHVNTIQPTDISNNENRTIPSPVTSTLTVRTLSDLSISKAFTPPAVSPGGISTLTITLQNTNTSPLVNTSVTDPLPGTTTNGIIVAPVPNASTTCAGGTVTAAAGSQSVTMTGGQVPAQVDGVPGTCTITVDVQGVGSQTTRTNTIPAENVSGTVLDTGTTISPADPARADLAIRNLVIGVVKGFDPLTVFGGSASTMSIQLFNPNNVSMSGIAFTDSMPEGMILADPPNPLVGDCGGTVNATAGAGSFSFSGGSLGASSSCVITIRVTMTVNGNLTNVMSAGAVTTLSGASNPDPAEASLTNLPGASVSKAFSPNPIPAGAVSRLTITIRNTGAVALSGMGFRDVLPGTLPVGLEIADPADVVNDCGGTLTAVPGTQLILLENSSLALNSSCTVLVNVTGRINGSYTNTIDTGNLTTREGATNMDPTSDTLVITGDPITDGGGQGRGTNPSSPTQGVSGFLIPVTGFPPDSITELDAAAHPSYNELSIQMEIPVIGVNTSVVGVEINNGGWDVSWLQDQAGWLNGTAFPTWRGNSVMTGHVVNTDGKPGIFSKLKYLRVGEYIYIQNAGYRYIYQVVSNTFVTPDDVTVFQHEEQRYLTLLTCDEFNDATGDYLLRVAVRARLVDIRIVR